MVDRYPIFDVAAQAATVKNRSTVGIARTVGLLLARMSPNARGWLGTALALEVVSRLSIVATAVFVTEGSAFETSAVALASAVVFALLRTAQAIAKVRVRCDVHAITSRAVLAGDVMGASASSTRRVVLDGSYHAIELVGRLAPSVAGDLIAALAIAPFLVATSPPRVLVLAGIAVTVVAVVTAALRASTERIEQGVVDAYDEVMETLLGSIESRLEIVARGGEDEFVQLFDRQLAHYASFARRTGIAGGLLTRAPLAAGALAVLLVLAVDGASRSALQGAILAQTLVFVACLPPIYGALLGGHGMVKSLVHVRPLLALLTAPPRSDVTDPKRGSKLVLPTSVHVDALRFGYDDDNAPVLGDLSFTWREGEPLVLTGPNGSGKSTLFKLLLGLRAPSSGTIRYGDRELGSFDVRTLRREVAYLPQRPYVGEPYTPVRASMRLVSRDATDDAMRGALARVSVLDALRAHGTDELATPVGELSAGQRQRVALARVLLQDARMMLLDEPDADLDRQGVELVATLVRELCASGKMVAIAAHAPELAALSSSPVQLTGSTA
jgi:ABC-type multidrug transport system fused ATPase/permease subunit